MPANMVDWLILVHYLAAEIAFGVRNMQNASGKLNTRTID